MRILPVLLLACLVLFIGAEKAAKEVSEISDSTAKHKSHDHDQHGSHAIVIFLVLTVFVGSFSRWLLGNTSSVPYTVLIYIYGLFLGHWARRNDSVMSSLGVGVADIDPKLMLTLFLPALLFESAFFIDISTFRRVSPHCALLAGPGCLISTLALGSGIKWLYPQWHMAQAMLMGAIMSATDPVSVVAILKESSCSKKTSVMIEGESLVNDAAAIIMFELLAGFLKIGHMESWEAMAKRSGQLLLIAPFMGWIAGRLLCLLIRHSWNDAIVETTTTLTGAYMTYYIAEEFHTSGVLAIVTCGLVLNYRRSNISPEVEHFMHQFWEIITFLANTTIFMMVGIQTRWALGEVFVDYGTWQPIFFIEDGVTLMCNLCLLFLILTAGRFIMVYAFFPFFNLMTIKIDWQNAFLIAFAGLRGAVALALVIQVRNIPMANMGPDDDSFRRLANFYIAGLVMLTMLVNGILTSRLVQALGIGKLPSYRTYGISRGLRRVCKEHDRMCRLLQGDSVLADAPWELLTTEEHKIEARMSRLSHFFDHSEENRREVSRVQVIRAFQNEVWIRYKEGLIGHASIRRLMKAADDALENGSMMNTVALHIAHEYMNPNRAPRQSLLTRIGMSIPGFKNTIIPLNVYSCYDVGFNFVQAQQAVLDKLSNLTDDYTYAELENCTQTSISLVRGKLQRIQTTWPEITRATKARTAARMILNSDRKVVRSLVADGHLEPEDGEALIEDIEKAMLKLKDQAPSLYPPRPREVMEELPWFAKATDGDKARLLECELMTANEGKILSKICHTAGGMGVIVSGILRNEYENKSVDYLGPGKVFNVLAMIASQTSLETVTVQSKCDYYWVPQELLQSIFLSSPSMKRELMRVSASRYVANILSKSLPYALWDKLRVMQNADEAWLLKLVPSDSKVHRHASPARMPSGMSVPVSPSSLGPDPAITFHQTPPSSTAFSGFGSKILRRTNSTHFTDKLQKHAVVPKPKELVSSQSEDSVEVSIISEYEYIVISGQATFGDGAVIKGPALLKRTDDQQIERKAKIKLDSWVVVMPRYDLQADSDDDGVDDDDGRLTIASHRSFTHSRFRSFEPSHGGSVRVLAQEGLEAESSQLLTRTLSGYSAELGRP